MLKVLGCTQVAVLDGGMQAWDAEGLPTTTGSNTAKKEKLPATTAPCSTLQDQIATYDVVLDLVQQKVLGGSDTMLIDARGRDRFNGEAPEPRAGLLKGHIPSSKNVPFASLLTEVNGVKKFQDKESLKAVLLAAGVHLEADRYYFSCGSGVTACIPLLVLVEHFNVDFGKCVLYDGSFAEWGKPELKLPVAP